MTSNLTVTQGSTVVLNEQPPASLAGNFQQVQINTLDDLVTHGIIESPDTIRKLLEAAKDTTASALATRRKTFVPFVAVPGTMRPDLRRFSSFTAAVPDVSPAEVHSFWRVARAIDPSILSTVKVGDALKSAPRIRVIPGMNHYTFKDITVEANGILTVAASVHRVRCGNLLIKNTGRILVEGGGVVIKAFSLKGE